MKITISGMPGAGKSTAGVILAKTLGMKFIDTDIVLQEKSGRLLQEMIDGDGPDAFLKGEEETLLSPCRLTTPLLPRAAVLSSAGGQWNT